MKNKSIAAVRKMRFVLLVLLVQLIIVVFAGAAIAGVTLTPRVTDGGTPPTGDDIPEDYVYFGQYPHWSGYVNNTVADGNTYEDSPSPILWRVMSADVAAQKAILLSHYTLDTNKYNTTTANNAWDGSSMRTFLNTDENVTRYHRNGSTSDSIPGFLHESRFTASEGGAMVDLGPDGIGKMTLPSSSDMNINWFKNDGTGDASRQAGYINQLSTNHEAYWTRSPNGTANAQLVGSDGDLRNGGLVEDALGVRPAFSLNLESVIFKSKSSDVFALDLNLAAEGGQILNPFCLFFGADLQGTASVSGDVLSVDFAVDIGKIKDWPASSDFTVTRDTTPIGVTAVTSSDASPRTLVLTLADDVVSGDVVTLSYAVSVDAKSGDLLTGAISSGDARPGAEVQEGFSGKAVANLTPDPDPDTDPDVVSTDVAQFVVLVTYNADGTVSVEVRLPFADNFDPDTLAAISAVFSNLTDITYTFVDADGNVVPLGTARRAGNAYMRIDATAESVATMSLAELSSISYWLKDDDTEYKQDFDPTLKLSAMQITYTNDPPSTNSSGGVGCSAGLGSLGALGLFGLIAPLAVARRRRR